MLTLYVRRSENRLEIGRGELRAQFEQQDNFWVPAWMWLGDRRMLRFKNHEWLALGHVRPRAYDWEMIEDSPERVLVRFWGDDSYFGVPVNWSVWVGADLNWPGFVITTEIVPSRTIELVEGFSRFETPCDYAGNEVSLCLIGQNPGRIYRGQPVLAHPDCRSGLDPAAGSVTCSAVPTSNPVCCFRAGPDQKGNERYVTLLGHWDTCCFRHIAVAPTAFVENRRAYEFLVGALDWRCLQTAESNVFFEGGHPYRQRLSIAFSSEMPGGTLDQWLYGAFERNVRLFFPEGAVMEAAERARAKKVTLADANAWLIEMISGNGVPGLYSPDSGIVNYTEGSCPEAGRPSFSALAPWLGALAYQAYVTRRAELQAVCEKWAERVAMAADRVESSEITPDAIVNEVLPLLRYLTCFPNGGLHGPIGRVLGQMLRSFPPDAGSGPEQGFCIEAFCAEAYILAGQLAGDKQLFDSGIACLERMNAKARTQLQRNGGAAGMANGAAGPQIRLVGCGHAVLANLLAYQRTHQDQHLAMAGTFSRYLVSLCYGTFNASSDPDFDMRGFASRSCPGGDRLIECCPVESSDSLRCVAYWLAFQPANPAGFYDLLWLLSRTFVGVFPAARERRSGFSVAGQAVTHPNEELPTEIAYRRFPYIAYENPVRQTRQSPRASVEALQNYLTFGGGLASCDNDKLLVLLPRAAGFDLSERVKRVIHVYNPTDRPETTRLAAHNLAKRRQFDVLVGNDTIAHEMPAEAVCNIAIHVPPRRAVIVEVVPSRPPSTSF